MMLGGNNLLGLGKGTVFGLDVFLYIALTAVPGWLFTMALLQTYNIAYVVALAALLALTIIGIAAKIKRGNKLITP